MRQYLGLAAALTTVIFMTGSVAGLSLQQPDSEEFNQYMEKPQKDVEEKIEEKVKLNESNNSSIEERIEKKMEKKTQEIKQRKKERITAQATKKDSKGFFSAIMSIFR